VTPPAPRLPRERRTGRGARRPRDWSASRAPRPSPGRGAGSAPSVHAHAAAIPHRTAGSLAIDQSI